MWLQVTIPNVNIKQILQGQPLSSWMGWCMAYVEQSIGLRYVYDTAAAGWNNARGRHSNKNVPKGVWIPLWYSGYYDQGHVLWAFFRTDGTGVAYSSPFSHKTSPDVINFSSLDNLNKQLSDIWYDLKYLGWSEYVDNKQIVKFEKNNNGGSASGGYKMNESDLTAVYNYGPLALGGYIKRSRAAKEGSNVYIGKTAAFVIKDHYNSEEAKRKRNALKKEIDGLKNTITKLKLQAGSGGSAAASDAEKRLNAIKDALGIR